MDPITDISNKRLLVNVIEEFKADGAQILEFGSNDQSELFSEMFGAPCTHFSVFSSSPTRIEGFWFFYQESNSVSDSRVIAKMLCENEGKSAKELIAKGVKNSYRERLIIGTKEPQFKKSVFSDQVLLEYGMKVLEVKYEEKADTDTVEKTLDCELHITASNTVEKYGWRSAEALDLVLSVLNRAKELYETATHS